MLSQPEEKKNPAFLYHSVKFFLKIIRKAVLMLRRITLFFTSGALDARGSGQRWEADWDSDHRDCCSPKRTSSDWFCLELVGLQSARCGSHLRERLWSLSRSLARGWDSGLSMMSSTSSQSPESPQVRLNQPIAGTVLWDAPVSALSLLPMSKTSFKTNAFILTDLITECGLS